MFTTFEGEFGAIKVAKIRCREFRSSGENEFFVKILDFDGLATKEIPKGGCRVIQWGEVPSSCPHCHKELPTGLVKKDFKEFEVFEYHGATVLGREKVALSYDDYKVGEIIELRIHYEVLYFKNHVTNQIMVMGESNVTKGERVTESGEYGAGTGC